MSNQQLASRAGVPTMEVIPIDASGNVLDPTNVLPTGATATSNSSGNVANASAAATLAGVAAKFTYISGFACTGGGATAGTTVNVTVAGVAGGTMTFNFGVPTGADLNAAPLVVQFNPPLKSSAVNTNIVVTMAALGAGNAHAAANAWGFTQ